MEKETINSPTSSSSSNSTPSITEPPEATIVDLSVNSDQVHQFPAALRRRRSPRVRRAAAIIPPVPPELNQLGAEVEADVDDAQQAVDPRVRRLRIIPPKRKADQSTGPSARDTRRLRILAEVCHESLKELGEVSSSSEEW